MSEDDSLQVTYCDSRPTAATEINGNAKAIDLSVFFFFLLGCPIEPNPNPNGHEVLHTSETTSNPMLSFQFKQTFKLKLCVQELR